MADVWWLWRRIGLQRIVKEYSRWQRNDMGWMDKEKVQL